MNKNIILIFITILSFTNIIYTFDCQNNIKKTCIVPLSDAYPSRYTYHKPFPYNQTDSLSQWLCKGNFIVRYQNLIENQNLTSFLFDSPMTATMNPTNGTYNAGVLGLGFGANTESKTRIQTHRNSFFIDCTVEISKLSSPYYLHVGIPIQGTHQRLSLSEEITTDKKTIKGGFSKEYQPSAPASLEEWKTTASPFISAIKSGMIGYLEGAPIGNLEEPKYGKISQCPMSLWALADIYLQFGRDGNRIRTTHFGYYAKGIIPTTPTLKSAWNKFMFYPTAGNVDRAEFGIGLNGHTDFFNNDISSGTLFFDGYAGFMLRSDELRPYDLKNGFFSRYGQVKLFSKKTTVYQNKNIRAIDLTTEGHSIGNCFKSEIVLDFIYQKWQSFFDVGYSFKSQGKESMECTDPIHISQSASAAPYIFGYSPQQYTQTPNPHESIDENWTTKLITPNSSMTSVSEEDTSKYKDTNESIVGVPITEENQFTRQTLDLTSGLMNTQILNIFFIGYSYQRVKEEYNTIFSIKTAVSQTTKQYYTPPFFEVLFSLELDY